ncbi:hypothetical protein BO86DRAFT_381474 [Aspergillus japonicus CBS 114.51]|uniref:Uncharacterized protein n=2 Tax=Aspergillus TaxID=5052 RepID=A0A2V5HG07_ASPV1|nr:hypothetical protein BO86DRAFT_381474 [Aspergillus japonicus CBS 114.51]PYI14920.1 hypothetical protein BO99DRAFT_416378 [Aspergillus violaceofuscus CBS 115571]RAH79194.1 hypothetical protein BO86DRAFT_381474 [Aspergillus japonicus CBS 114.51]
MASTTTPTAPKTSDPEEGYADLLATAREWVDSVLFMEQVQEEIEAGFALRTELRSQNERAFLSLLAALPDRAQPNAATLQRLEETNQQMSNATGSLREKLRASRRQMPMNKAQIVVWLWVHLRPADARALVAKLNGGLDHDASGGGADGERAVKDEEGDGNVKREAE